MEYSITRSRSTVHIDASGDAAPVEAIEFALAVISVARDHMRASGVKLATMPVLPADRLEGV